MTKALIFALFFAAAAFNASAVTFDFEDGNQGWKNIEGWLGDFRKPIGKALPSVRIPATGKFLIQTHHKHAGIIESPVFTVNGPEAKFMMGGSGAPNAYLTLHTADGKEVRRQAVPHRNEADLNKACKLQDYTWDLSPLKGKKVFLRLQAEPMGYHLVKRGHSNLHESFISFDNFTVPGTVDQQATKQRAEKLQAEKRESMDAIKDATGDVIFAVRKFYREGHWYANIGHWSGDANKKMFHDGARLCRLNVWSGKAETLFEDPKGGIRDPQVHYDGKKVIFSYRPGGSDYYNLYEMDLDRPGKLRRITNAPYDDIEPTYTPEGKIVFVSTRCKRWVPCYYTEVAVLYTCNADGSGLRTLSGNVEHENTPWPLPDGRILYTRWEYVERSVMDFHHLWTANPDGTRQQVYFGNMHPGYVMIDAKPIPGSRKVASIFSPGHGRMEHAGSVAVVDPGKGPDRKESARNIGWHHEARDVYPIGNRGFLIARKHTIAAMNYQGREEPIFSLSDEEGEQGYICSEPRPILPRKRERIIPSTVNLKRPTGTLVLDDVYVGRNMEGVKRGSIKKLMVLEYLPKSLNVSNGSEPCSRFTHNHETILGTVPVQADGSASFEVPALTPVFLAALDENDMCIKRMQSFLTVQPGETLGCVGCHEERMQTPKTSSRRSMAMMKQPEKIEPITGIPYVFDFQRDIQPILNKHCVSCHDYDKTANGGPRAGGVILTGDRNGRWSQAYTHLTSKSVRMGSRMGNNAPYTAGSGGSGLMKKLEGSDGSSCSHNMTDLEKKMIRCWIDSGAIYCGTLAGEGCGMIYAKINERKESYRWFSMPAEWPQRLKAAKEVVSSRCASCHDGKNKPKVYDLDVTRAQVSESGIKKMNAEARVNFTRPEKSTLLLAPLAMSDGGYALCREKGKGRGRTPNTEHRTSNIEMMDVFKSKADPGYKALLAYMRTLKKAQDINKGPEMPGFRPTEHYVREMKRYGIIPQDFDRTKDEIDVFAADRAYWNSVRWKP